ncbi:hypothetical protein [Granulicella arctica]|uniref:hypothetical protein n=1 Tax=Granulicella arctica TaxID=940613 RepID=UPI0021E0CA1B|nr:hypothetical protein [Granulicella arctica]
MRRSIDSVPEIVKFVLLTMALYFAAQTVIVILHEHAHSTAAWFLGYTRTPFYRGLGQSADDPWLG